MIELYTFGTGNGKRASVILEECGLAYNVHKVDLAKGEQMSPEFRRINPLGVIPAIVDSDGPGGKPLTLTQSGAIALYCAEKSGRFLPEDPLARLKVIEWLMHAVTDAAPTTGFIFQSGLLPEKPVAVLDKFKGRLLGFLRTADAHLANHEYLAGDLSIADFALYTSAVTAKHLLGPQFTGFANVDRWMAALAARPGVAKGMQVPA